MIVKIDTGKHSLEEIKEIMCDKFCNRIGNHRSMDDVIDFECVHCPLDALEEVE